MARTKTKLRYIVNDSDRRTTLKKRRNGVIKKVREISILCDVPACAIIYEPESPLPMVWPNAQQAIRVLDEFRSLPEMAQRRKMLTQEEFIFRRKEKMQEQLRRHRRECNEIELNICVNRVLAGMSLNNLRIEEARGIDHIINVRQRALKDRMKTIMETEIAPESSKGKAPMYAEKEQQVAPHNFWFTDAFVREWVENDMAQKAVTLSESGRGKAPMYPTTPQNYSLIDAAQPMYQTAVLPQQTYSLIDAAEQERLQMERQQKSITWSYDLPALNDQMSFQNSMGAVGSVGGLEEAMQPYLNSGTPWADSDSFPF